MSGFGYEAKVANRPVADFLQRDLAYLVTPAEHVFNTHAEQPCYSERTFEARGIATLLDGYNGLPGHSDCLPKRGLTDLAVLLAKFSDAIGDWRAIGHFQEFRRISAI